MLCVSVSNLHSSRMRRNVSRIVDNVLRKRKRYSGTLRNQWSSSALPPDGSARRCQNGLADQPERPAAEHHRRTITCPLVTDEMADIIQDKAQWLRGRAPDFRLGEPGF